MGRLRRAVSIAVFAFLLLATLATGRPALWYATGLAGALLLSGRLLVELWLRRILLVRSPTEIRIGAGEQAPVGYRIINRSPFPIDWLEVGTPTSAFDPLPVRISVPPRGERSWDLLLDGLGRGVWRLEPARLRTRDPFGFTSGERRAGGEATVVVHPRIEPLPRWRIPGSRTAGGRASRRRTLDESPVVRGIRPWAPGDPPNRIHWRASARYGELHTRELEPESEQELWLLVDLDERDQAGAGEAGSLETLLRATASIAARSLDEGHRVGLLVRGAEEFELTPARGPGARSRILEALAVAHPSQLDPLAERLSLLRGSLRPGTSLVVLSASTDPAWPAALAGVRSSGFGLAVVAHPAAFAPPGALRAADEGFAAALASAGVPIARLLPETPLGELLAP